MAKHERRLEIVKGLVKASQIIDQIIQLIKEVSGSKQAVIEALVAKHHFSQLQAQAIANCVFTAYQTPTRVCWARRKKS
ncbi:hypothetical protein [Mycoplasma sp. ATU-Cv-508]|uniref:hypothetical protein n=1 Tax=Mycoplasma sp. ATU-Cv-508 TaxID=2048001 RepID=UPI0031F326AA